MFQITSVWIVIALFLLFAELGAPGLFFFVSFAFGALVSAFFSMFFFSLTVQLTMFISVSLATFFVIRVLLKRAKFSDVHHESVESNIDALVGKTAVVTKLIKTSARGHVKIGAEEWVAQSVENQEIEVGERVRVVSVSGNKVLVKR